MFRWNHLCFSLCPLLLVVSLGTTENILIWWSCHPPFGHLYTFMRSTLSLLFSRLNNPSSLSLSSQKRCSSPLIILWPFTGLQNVYASLMLKSSELDTVLQMWPHQSWVKWKDHHSWPAGNTLPNGAQGTISLLYSKGRLLAHVQFCVHQDHWVLFCKAAFQLRGPECILVHEVIPFQVQVFVVPLVEIHEAP